MSCDCEHPTLYSAKIVKVRKAHKCVECERAIAPSQKAEKVDGLWDGQFQTLYTCLECAEIRDFLQEKFPDELCCHGELEEFLYQNDFVYSDDDIEDEARDILPRYDDRLGVIRGRHCIIASFVPWLVHKNGKFCLAEDYQ